MVCPVAGWCRWEASGLTISVSSLKDVSLSLQVSTKVVIAQTTDRRASPQVGTGGGAGQVHSRELSVGKTLLGKIQQPQGSFRAP